MIQSNLFKLATIAVLSVAVCEPILAQTATNEGEITVTAPRTRERSPTGIPIEIVTTSRIVSYADLDLKTDPGKAELENRVKLAARKACELLNRLSPVTLDSDATCIKSSVDGATVQVNAALAAALAK